RSCCRNTRAGFLGARRHRSASRIRDGQREQRSRPVQAVTSVSFLWWRRHTGSARRSGYWAESAERRTDLLPAKDGNQEREAAAGDSSACPGRAAAESGVQGGTAWPCARTAE